MGEITLLQGLVVYGPLGVMTALGIYGTISKDREVRDARIAHAKEIKDQGALYAAALKAQSDDYLERYEVATAAYTEALAEVSARHDKRMDEMHTRFTALAAMLVDRSQILFDKVGVLADALTRRS